MTALLPVEDRLSRHVGIASVRLAADRGMIGQRAMETLEERGWGYIPGVRPRSSKGDWIAMFPQRVQESLTVRVRREQRS